ncbi:MAG TPA: MGMT family protein [Candidatus Paceibacterota bacterium]|nr:MGMT family protein [Candidatus Paceibacterota bacterium]
MRNAKNDFKSHVLEIVASIPAGHTKSYKEVSILAGNPHAARAVARIMSANFNPNIPCHRVIRANGTLGGYNRGGSVVKKRILERERKTNFKTLT